MKLSIRASRPLVFLGTGLFLLVFQFSFLFPAFAQSSPRAGTAQGSSAQNCAQPPQNVHLMTLSNAQLSLYGLPLHNVLDRNPALWSAVLAHARDHTCTSSPVGGKTANVTEYYDCCWAGNEARGSRGTYRAADVTFTIPTVSSSSPTQTSTVSFWAGVGGDNFYQTTSYELIQAGVTLSVSPSGAQSNYAWWETAGTSGNNGPNSFSFAVHRGNTIYAYVDSNLSGDGYNTYYVENETTGAYGIHNDPPNYFSDSATGECIGEKNSPQLADFGTEWLDGCTICTSSTCKGIASWTHDYYVVTDNGKSSGTKMITVGSINSSGNYPVYWKSST
jgi:hypothetical protein